VSLLDATVAPAASAYGHIALVAANFDLCAGLNDISIAVCVTLIIDNTTVEIKNLAVRPDFHRCGFGRLMLKHVECENPDKSIILGTGETPSTLRFYEKCGYRYSHRIPNFFTDNYSNPIIEEGVILRDMVYLRKDNA